MKIERQQIGSVEVLKPRGALVEDDSAIFGGTLNERLEDGNPRLVLDLQEVSYVDSSALEALLNASDHFLKQNSRLRLVKVSGTVREVMDLTGLSGRFQYFESVEDAVRSFL